MSVVNLGDYRRQRIVDTAENARALVEAQVEEFEAGRPSRAELTALRESLNARIDRFEAKLWLEFAMPPVGSEAPRRRTKPSRRSSSSPTSSRASSRGSTPAAHAGGRPYVLMGLGMLAGFAIAFSLN